MKKRTFDGTTGFFHELPMGVGCLILKIKYHGYDDPGVSYGPAEDCYPPESDLEFEVISASIELSNKNGDFETHEIDHKTLDLSELEEKIKEHCWSES